MKILFRTQKLELKSENSDVGTETKQRSDNDIKYNYKLLAYSAHGSVKRLVAHYVLSKQHTIVHQPYNNKYQFLLLLLI